MTILLLKHENNKNKRNLCPNLNQTGTEMSPKRFQKGSNMVPKAYRMTPRAPRSAQERPKSAPEVKMAPKAPENYIESFPKC